MSKDFGRKGVEEVLEGSCKVEEEKKESTPKRGGAGAVESQTALQKAQEGLPRDLKYPVYFNNERDLIKELEIVGISDLQVFLNDEGYAVFREMPGEQHRGSVRMMERLFLSWVGNQDDIHNSSMLGEKEANIFLDDSVDKNAKRCPDFESLVKLVWTKREIFAQLQIVIGDIWST